MTPKDLDWLRLCDEHGRVVTAYGRAQRRASQLVAAQARRIEALEALEAQVMQLLAAAIVHQSALLWAREDAEALHATLPGLPKRRALAGHVRTLETRIRALIRAQTARPAVSERAPPNPPSSTEKVVLWVSRDDVQQALTQRAAASAGMRLVQTSGEDAALLNHNLADADLVICQVGCVSHGDWWRMKDYCTRKGKPCVLVDRPDALQRVIAARGPGGPGNRSAIAEIDIDTNHQDD